MRILLILLFISFPKISYSLELSKQEGIPSSLQESMWLNPSGPYTADAVYEYEKGKFYWLFKGISIGNYDFNINKNQGGWPISHWSHTYIPQTLIANYQFTSVGETDAQVAERLATPKSNHDGAGNLLSNVGCLPASPLRYGTVFNANENDLLVILGGQLIVFSPTYQRTVFSEFFYQHDVDDLSADNDPPAWQTPQAHYGALHYFKHGAITVHAVRSYAKLYDGDFDGDGHPDVLVWRKTYRANPITEEPGYSLVETSFAHFEQNLTAQAASEDGVTDEYLPQTTKTATIQSWLADKNLTWQKGYPSKSECPGQEGQLIPEMHDPLLNDPDVLK